ncbi:MAG: succinate dehydrogenase [Chloroflexi bacterium]|nr:succinate dehydrogenase [Chloroflexota bacterium]
MTVEARSVRQPAPRAAPGRGRWWIQPVTVATGFTLFLIYGFWTVWQAGGHGWEHGPYLSPFYSPLIKLSWWPFSSAFLVAWAPIGFRATCYYYRKAYYRAYFWDPPACAIREPAIRKNYRGERAFPFILNNFHRFFLYLALIILTILWIDTIDAFHYTQGVYIGLGSVLMLANVILLTSYTLSCHALRHLVGGSVDCFSCARAGNVRYGMWGLVTRINPYHGSFAWASLISVAVVDMYIRLVSSGALGSCFGAHTGC